MGRPDLMGGPPVRVLGLARCPVSPVAFHRICAASIVPFNFVTLAPRMRALRSLSAEPAPVSFLAVRAYSSTMHERKEIVITPPWKAAPP